MEFLNIVNTLYKIAILFYLVRYFVKMKINIWILIVDLIIILNLAISLWIYIILGFGILNIIISGGFLLMWSNAFLRDYEMWKLIKGK